MNDPNKTTSQDPVDPTAPALDAFLSDQPQHIGRYPVVRVLGDGGFGRVYLARDQQLNRAVAIKVPRPERLSRPEDIAAYLAEARNVAQLDHPNIVPVYDVGTMPDGLCYVVSKVVEGSDLKTKIAQARPSHSESAELIATVAEALHYAHRKGLVHRDIKPANILIDTENKPYVADFGLALREEDFGKALSSGGTPAYMSPEQARGEGHRVDGRSDIFSLSVVFYELLVGRRPFKADTQDELLKQIAKVDVRPPRQYEDSIPKELERICLKALSRRASERYTTAKDMADDLRHFLSAQNLNQQPSPTTNNGDSPAIIPVPPTSTLAGAGTSATPPTPVSDSQPIKIVPKGLRSFDAHDADFFLELLPGPRDRDGLPDSIRFWKTRIEEKDADNTFSVGLIYGPSGCGKSSLVKAGLLPCLSNDVIAVYVESTAEETETRLLNGLRKRCPALLDNLTLKETLVALRRGQGVPLGKKVLIVLDQFEQWLHAKKDEQNTELVAGLRQCDGGRVQCIVMVRDDFWMAATRFMQELDIRLLEGQNSAAVDLFPIRHAEKVLAAFGRAFGVLPNASTDTSKDQKQFVELAVAGLAQEGKVVCVRFALFAEMMKAKDWTPVTFKAVGGTEGIGVTFLEETFSAATAPPEHRYHQKGARAVLKSLLPESGTDIKGQMKSYEELLAASGYGSRPKDFDDLIRILDSEIRLITPTDPEGHTGADESTSNAQPGQKYYQLTHDYLVYSLREWLTRKQKETRRGRAELLLADRAAVWNTRPENRQLPSLWQWIQIHWLTAKKNWTPPQRKMMGQAGRVHATRAGLLLVTLVLGILGSSELNGRIQARNALTQLETADADRLQQALDQVNRYRRWADPALTALATGTATAPNEQHAQLHARLALVSREPGQVEALRQELLTSHVSYVGVIRDRLAPYQEQFQTQLWELLRDSTVDSDRRFRAGLALASYAPQSEQWTAADWTLLADQLVVSNPEHQPRLRAYLRPIQDRLLTDLENIFADPAMSESRQVSAANALAEFAAQETVRLTRLLTLATPEQYKVLYPLLTKAKHTAATESLAQLVRETPGEDLSQADRVSLGRRRAGAAITLLRQGQREQILDVLRVDADPESLTQFVHRCQARGVTASELLECVERVDAQRRSPSGAARQVEDRVLIGLLLALGDYPVAEIAPAVRQPWVDRLVNWYGQDPSSGIHGATGWLLRRWGFEQEVTKVDQTPVPYDATGQRDWFTLAIKCRTKGLLFGQDFVEELYFTFIVFPPGDYTLGTPNAEMDRNGDEELHRVKLTRPLAVCDRELNWGQYNPHDNRRAHDAWERQFNHQLADNDPAVGINWYEAVTYCRWLTAQAQWGESSQCYDDPATLPKNPVGNPQYERIDLQRGGFRLPTEAEWEVVCRSGTQTAYSFGNDVQWLGQYGWFQDTSHKWLHGIGQLRPNPRGLFDLHGNLYEWCHDWYDGYAAEAEDPSGPSRGSYRMIRGGSWGNDAALCRSAVRSASQPMGRTISNGFRLALSPSGVSGPAEQGQGKGAEPSGGGSEGASAEPRPEMP